MRTNIGVVEVQIDLQEPIRQRAYELYKLRYGRDSDELQDWLQAETETKAEQPEN